MKKIFLWLFLSSLVIGQNNNVKKIVDEYSNSPELRSAVWAISVRDVESGKILFDYNGGKALAPASGLKLFTTAAALNYLGSGYVFKTRLYFSGTVKNSLLDGNIFIRGGGDPTLGSGKVKGSLGLNELMRRWTQKIKRTGIKRIGGSIIADDKLFEGAPVSGYWYWIDLGNYYAAQKSALCINDNLYYLFFKPAKTVGGLAKFLRTEPKLEGILFVNRMKTGTIGSGDNGYVYRSPYDSIAYLRGTIPMGFDEFSIKGSLPDPPLFAAKLLYDNLIESGIKIRGIPQKTKGIIKYNKLSLLDEIHSPPLQKIVRRINKKSDNLYTSQILQMTGLKVLGKASKEAGIKAVFRFLAENKIDTSALMLFDGNGLSRSNTITTRMMTKMLCVVKEKEFFNSFYNSLSIAGDTEDDGSFKYFGRGTVLEKNARIKSGYIKGVRSHSGYLRTKGGKLIAFSIIVNNFKCDVKVINEIHKKLMIEIAEEF